MKGTTRRHGFACLLCMVIVLLAAVPASAVSFTTDGFFTTLDVGEDSSMHITEEIYVTFTSPGHGIYRQIPNSGTHSYFMHDGELVEAPLPYVIRNITCEGQEIATESEDGFLSIRIGSPDFTVTGAQKYKLEYDIVMYEDGIDYLDQLYWNVIPAYWETDIDFAGFTVNMPKAFDASSADVITGPVGSGDDSAASWDVEEDGTVLAGHVDALPGREGVTVRIVLPEGNKVDVLSVEQTPDVLRRAGQPVVGREGDDQRAAVSQVRLCRHSDGGVGHAVCKLCKSIPRARRNDHRLHRFARAERFRLGYGGHNVPPGYLHQPLDVLRGCAEAAVRLRCVFAHYRDKLIFFHEPFRLLEHPAVCTIRAAHRKAYSFFVLHAHSSPSLMTVYIVSLISSAAVYGA